LRGYGNYLSINAMPLVAHNNLPTFSRLRHYGLEIIDLADATRRHLRIIALETGRLIETGRCDLQAPVTGAVRASSPSEITVGLFSGRQIIAIADCRWKP